MSTHHPEERLIGELGVIFDGGKHTEDEADQHQHETETEVHCECDTISEIRSGYGGIKSSRIKIRRMKRTMIKLTEDKIKNKDTVKINKY